MKFPPSYLTGRIPPSVALIGIIVGVLLLAMSASVGAGAPHGDAAAISNDIDGCQNAVFSVSEYLDTGDGGLEQVRIRIVRCIEIPGQNTTDGSPAECRSNATSSTSVQHSKQSSHVVQDGRRTVTTQKQVQCGSGDGTQHQEQHLETADGERTVTTQRQFQYGSGNVTQQQEQHIETSDGSEDAEVNRADAERGNGGEGALSDNVETPDDPAAVTDDIAGTVDDIDDTDAVDDVDDAGDVDEVDDAVDDVNDAVDDAGDVDDVDGVDEEETSVADEEIVNVQVERSDDAGANVTVTGDVGE